MPNLTLLDIAKMNAADGVVGLIEETIIASPEVMGGTARTIKGTGYDTLHRTNVPLVGFRAANSGVAKCKSEYENKRVNTYIMDCASELDVAVSSSHEDGEAAALAIEAEGIVEGAFRSLSSQFYYGKGASSAGTSIAPDAGLGFPGIAEVVDASQVVDAGGTTADTASSVYAVRWGTRHVNWVLGQGGQFETSDPYITPDRDPVTGKCHDVWRTPLLWRIGLQLVNKHAVAQIKNITEDAGKGLTDELLGKMLATFPSGYAPTVLYMSRRSKEQLRASRTTFSPTGQPSAPVESAFNIVIVETDGIVNTEAIH